MATLNEIVYNIADNVDRADDAVLRERLKFMVAYYRARFIRQDQQKSHSLPESLYQSISCVEMIEANPIECCISPDINCTVWRTKNKVPRPIRSYDGSAFAYVGTVDGKEPYQEVSVIQAGYMRYSKWSKMVPQYIYMNDYIYVVDARPKAIMLKAIFERPEELGEWQCCDDVAVFSADKEYPCSLDIVQRITQTILSVEFVKETIIEDGNEIQHRE